VSARRPEAGNGWRYATPAVVLHWLLAVLIAAMVALGLYMMSIEDDPGADRYFGLHKSIGLLVFVLVLVRAEWLLYACMLLMPISGFLGASHTKSGIAFFGLPLPRWRAPDRDTAELFFAVHETVAWVLIALVAVHALGGLKHLLLDRDRVFQRMWF
jgi:cytochrome b561